SHDGVYDEDAHTVTWTQEPQVGRDPAAGWGPLNALGAPRTVTVVFPASMFTGECVMDVSTTLAVDMTYLDGQEKSVTLNRTHVANNCPPFAAGTMSAKSVPSRNAGSTGAPT